VSGLAGAVHYLGCRNLGRTTTKTGQHGRSGYNWKIPLKQFDIMFPGRLDPDLT
jgi:hypothetical protein